MLNANDVMKMKSVYFALKGYIKKRESIEMSDEELFYQLKEHINGVCESDNELLLSVWKDWN